MTVVKSIIVSLSVKNLKIRLNIDPIDVIWGGWVGWWVGGWVDEIITSIHGNMDVAPYLYCAIDDSVMLDLHNIFSMTMSSVKFCSLLSYQEVINGYALH
jgi:hypothetical protein